MKQLIRVNFCFLLVLFLALSFSFSLVSASTLKVTEEHPFLINGEWIPAKQLAVGDLLSTADGKKARITSIKEVVPENAFLVYNLQVNGAGNYFANGVLAHNKPMFNPFFEERVLIKVMGDKKIIIIPKSEYPKAAKTVFELEGWDYWRLGLRDEESKGFAIAAWKNRGRYMGEIPNEKIIRVVVFEKCDGTYAAIAARAETALSGEVVNTPSLGVTKCNEIVGIARDSNEGLGIKGTFEFYKQQVSLFVNPDGTVDTAIVFEVNNDNARVYKKWLGPLVEDITSKLGHAPTETIRGYVSPTKVETATVEINNFLIRPENVKPAITALEAKGRLNP